MNEEARTDVEQIGLLFIHGIGEQARFEHLKASVSELAELFDRTVESAKVSVVDRTPSWQSPPGEPHPAGVAPMTLSVRSPGMKIDFQCHEVWWADLGSRSGISDMIGFWLWGLGQWAAPIYREVDASRLPKDDQQSSRKATSSLVKLPKGIVGTWTEPDARFKLMLAALAAALTAITWSLAKRIAGALLSQAPSPTLITQYVGDVRTYTEPGGPGMGTTSDPGQPRRVGIRRRMVSEMVALASKPLDGWFVLAHSLGTVVAYNGLTEIGHALPNYLSEAQWRALPDGLKVDAGCQRRPDTQNMMPARPAWLDDHAVINRPQMFANLRGLFTYGSPLGKFAALWPRIVATATDRVDPEEKTFPPSPSCRWINFAAPHDPVAGMLDAFPTEPQDFLHNAIPTVENIQTPLGRDFLLSHIRYLKAEERIASGLRPDQKKELARWLLGSGDNLEGLEKASFRRWQVAIGYIAIISALWLAATFVTTLLLATLSALAPGDETGLAEHSHFLLQLFAHLILPVLGTALGLIILCGLQRWYRESRHNRRLADADRANDGEHLKGYWDAVVAMLQSHKRNAKWHRIAGAILLAAAFCYDWAQALADEGIFTFLVGTQILVASLLMISAAVSQMRINQTLPAAVPIAAIPKDGSHADKLEGSQ